MADSVLVVERREDAALLTLNRPQVRNALGPELMESLTAAVAEFSSDDGVRAIVITGAGAAFCAGADLTSLQALQAATVDENTRDCMRLLKLYKTLATCPKPVIGAVNGPALAGGCGLATCCDILLASPRATFGYPEVRIGFVAAMVLVILSRQLGDRRAREMLLTGRALSAEEACAAGLVREVVPGESLIEAALAAASRLAGGAPSALALTKELLWRTSGLGLDQALELAAHTNVFARTNPDLREGLDAFLSKRRPNWSRE
jgi:methylglutaconyl-CoA hydratase